MHSAARVEVPILRPHPNDRAAIFRRGQHGPYQLPETAFVVHVGKFPCGGPPETGVRIRQACGLLGAAGPDQEKALLIETTIARILRELEERYHHELMGEEERLELRERILKMRKKTGRI